jgi:hypothetical protein
MLICAAGDIHGKIDELYAGVSAFEKHLGRAFQCVLQVGDFGAWPDPDHVDKATREHNGAGDFPRWCKEKKTAPVPTVFIKGNHEDFSFLGNDGRQLLPDLWYLPNGMILDMSFPEKELFVAGVGGCYAESDSDEPLVLGRNSSPAHYTRSEVRGLHHGAKDVRVDVLLLHDAPDGVWMNPRGKHSGYFTRGPGLRKLVETLKPKICFFGHHHQHRHSEIAEVPVIGLNLIGRPGWLVAWDTETGLVDEWGV